MSRKRYARYRQRQGRAWLPFRSRDQRETNADRLTDAAARRFVLTDMANKTDKWENNVSGKFFVDQQCIDCDLCRETAPGFFTRHDEGGYSFVHKQPTTEEDVALCREALEGCPVEAIGDDGDA
jgi:ferredoxin